MEHVNVNVLYSIPAGYLCSAVALRAPRGSSTVETAGVRFSTAIVVAAALIGVPLLRQAAAGSNEVSFVVVRFHSRPHSHSTSRR